MSAKDKAKELVDKYYNILPLDKYVITKDEDLSWEYNDWKEAKKCALVAVDEIIKSEPTFNSSIFQGSFLISDNTEYWEEVKQEIINQ